ncbi:MAG: threonine/serine exporter family protein [Ruminiclostridium sp.]|nr:threonine/serine exporter family protein [Ruminiclostridium sp.]
MNKRDCETLLEYTLGLGRQMMECGAEAWRAENTMARIFRAYGMEVLDAHAMPTQVAATVKTKAGEHYPSTCMVLPEKTGMNLRRLEMINAAARQICFDPPPVSQLPTIKDNSPRWAVSELIGYILGIGAFAVFFGGNLLDGILSALIGCGIYYLDHLRMRNLQNRTIYIMIACFASGLLARLCAGIFPMCNLDMIVIGDIMIFIPGLSLVNGVRELFYSDILTGIYRMVEAVLGAGAIAIGYAVALMIGGGL